MVHRSSTYLSKIYQKGNWKNRRFPLEQKKKKKTRHPRHLAQLSIWSGGLVILDVDTQLNSLKMKWLQKLLNTTNTLWNGLMLYRYHAVFWILIKVEPYLEKNRSLGLIDTKFCKNRTTMQISLLNYLMLGHISLISNSLSQRLWKKLLTNPYF